MYFTIKTLVVALAAGAVAMPADTPHSGAAGGAVEKRDFLGFPFPNITDILKGKPLGRRGEEEDGPKLPGPPDGGKNATKPAPGAKHVRREAHRPKLPGGGPPGHKNMTMPAGEDEEGGGEEGSEGEEGGAPKKPEGSGAPEKPKKPKGSGAPKPPKASGAPEPPVAAAGSAPAHAPKANGTVPHPPGPKAHEKRTARAPAALPIRFWA
ncbi:hypothetical protein PG994_001185 [Apiospora phragmitis]|uniref:Uncharacterized protein n=1 Tax=Apiospora phragmitis TaxID=2905665 RepID=A0ABR1WST5_9PEZI